MDMSELREGIVGGNGGTGQRQAGGEIGTTVIA